MQFYFAPLEGVTGYVYRNAFHEHFDKMYKDMCLRHTIDKYYAPFISPGNHKNLTSKENSDVDPNNNQGICLVPQVLTNDAGCFLRTAEHLEELGYTEINLNLGCPSGTVVAKKKGAGLLEDTRMLDAFLKEIYEGTKLNVSIKTRIGVSDTEEWPEILKIFNQYPVKELIVHPRLREDQYAGEVHMDQFAYTMEHAKMPVCYNGDIFKISDYSELEKQFPKLKSVMLGRGLLANPALVRQIYKGQPVMQTEFVEFHNQIFAAYEKLMSGERNLLFKMKELWNYWVCLFENPERNIARLKKVESKQEYMMIVSQIVKYCDIVDKGYRVLHS